MHIYAYLFIHYTNVLYGTQLTFVLVPNCFVLEKSLGPYVYLYNMHHVQYLYILYLPDSIPDPIWSLITKSKGWRCGYKISPLGSPINGQQKHGQLEVASLLSRVSAPSLKLVTGAHFDTVDGKNRSEIRNNHRTSLKLRK